MSEAPIDHATRLGRDAGKNAASWVFDGNTEEATYRRVLKGIREGDPEVMDAYREPDLSGEFDGLTPSGLVSQTGLPEGDPGEAEADICSAWEGAARDAFWGELERVCVYQTT